MRGVSRENIRFVILICLIVMSLALGWVYRGKIDLNEILIFLQGVPLQYSAPAFVLLFVVGTFFLWYLHDALYIISLLVYGTYISTFLLYLGHVINAAIFFKLSKSLGKAYVERKVRGKYFWIYEKIEKVNFGWLFLMRLLPFIPYRALDLIFGLSRFSFRKYMIVALLASPIRIFFMQFGLAMIKDFLTLDKGIDLKRIFTGSEAVLFIEQNAAKLLILFIAYTILIAIWIIVIAKFRKKP